MNPIDWKIRAGTHRQRPSDRADRAGFRRSRRGRLRRGASGGFAVGDAVIARGVTGAYASRVAAPSAQLTRKPPSMSCEEGAALGMPAGTAYQALKSLGVGRRRDAADPRRQRRLSAWPPCNSRAIGVSPSWPPRAAAHHARLAELGAIPVAYGDGLLDRVRAAAPGRYRRGARCRRHRRGVAARPSSSSPTGRGSRRWWPSGGSRSGHPVFSEHFGGGLGVAGRALRVEGIAVAADLAERGLFQIDIAGVYPWRRSPMRTGRARPAT